jgi:hypothetical protein
MAFKDLSVLSCLREICTLEGLVLDDTKNEITYITLREYGHKYYVELGTHSLQACHYHCRSKENETKIFQSHGKRTSVLEMTTEEIQTEIQIVLYGKSHTQPGVVRN